MGMMRSRCGVSHSECCWTNASTTQNTAVSSAMLSASPHPASRSTRRALRTPGVVGTLMVGVAPVACEGAALGHDDVVVDARVIRRHETHPEGTYSTRQRAGIVRTGASAHPSSSACATGDARRLAPPPSAPTLGPRAMAGLRRNKTRASYRTESFRGCGSATLINKTPCVWRQLQDLAGGLLAGSASSIPSRRWLYANRKVMLACLRRKMQMHTWVVGLLVLRL
jgi:hypothetical protein